RRRSPRCSRSLPPRSSASCASACRRTPTSAGSRRTTCGWRWRRSARRRRRVERAGWATAVGLLLVGGLALLGVVLRGGNGNAAAGRPLHLAVLPPAG